MHGKIQRTKLCNEEEYFLIKIISTILVKHNIILDLYESNM